MRANQPNTLTQATTSANLAALCRLPDTAICKARSLARFARTGLGVAALAAIAVTTPAVADSDARGWIEKMSVAMQDLDYNGTFVYLHGGDIESMKIYHRKKDGIEHERLVSLNGEAREIIRNADDVICIWPGSKSVIVSKAKPRTPFPRFEPAQMQSLQSHYRFEELAPARIADRPARTIDISPLDEYRYGYRLWIDQETSLLLRSAMSDYTGAVLEQVMFTEIEVEESVPMEIFQVASTGKRYEWLAGTDLQERLQPEIETDIPSVKKMALPNGFELTGEQISPVAGSSKPARRLMYSDGLSSVSVFVAESGGENGDLLGTSTMGAVSAFGIDLGQWHATVVGEVPIHTVKMVGESIELATP
jgi:sigma-E factor negative regulatory protein RseB